MIETGRQIRSFGPRNYPLKMISRLIFYIQLDKIMFCAWWRHQMEPFSALLALCAGNSPVPVNSPHKGQWRGALMFYLICAWINDWINNREAGDLRRHRGHYDVSVMEKTLIGWAHTRDNHCNGFVENCGNSGAIALELPQSCIYSSIWG